ncbi:hypothetical protein M514_02443 [Trichuris suis]|uniref:Uncharacterized protein n=1 Tax=Trichuris suis TaxID=68888 RepID=A0A085N5N1_9BILA|nr:hypothetical protein M513_02443 [Trichuris suis]KFD64777.1 hypothetical protein M514_02443 [Trichuris suis]
MVQVEILMVQDLESRNIPKGRSPERIECILQGVALWQLSLLFLGSLWITFEALFVTLETRLSEVIVARVPQALFFVPVLKYTTLDYYLISKTTTGAKSELGVSSEKTTDFTRAG